MMNLVDRFRGLSTAEKARLISGAVFSTFYLALGVVFLFVRNLPFTMSQPLKTGFAIILLAYAGFRLSRVVASLRYTGGALDTCDKQDTGK